LMTLLSDTACHSFIGEVGALNTHHDTPPYPVTPSPTSGHSSGQVEAGHNSIEVRLGRQSSFPYCETYVCRATEKTL
jgi:hypothetical protein